MKNLNNLIQILQKANIDFVIVGGYSAVLHGSSMVTQDLDICIHFHESEILNLRKALESYHPVHRMTPQRLSFLEYPQEIKNVKNIYLETDLGILDILGFVGGVGTFEDVKKNALKIDFFGHQCFLLSIQDLIQAKKYLGRPKDIMVVKELECILKKENE